MLPFVDEVMSGRWRQVQGPLGTDLTEMSQFPLDYRLRSKDISSAVGEKYVILVDMTESLVNFYKAYIGLEVFVDKFLCDSGEYGYITRETVGSRCREILRPSLWPFPL